jgi:NADH-quinone oxidoreductase subunit J
MSLFFAFHFYFFGVIAIAAAVAFVTRRSPVAAAMWLVTTMFCLAAMYVMLGAEFIGAIQVLVYAGAIMVVFLFVVMLLNLGHGGELAWTRGRLAALVAVVLGLGLLAQLMTLVRGTGSALEAATPPADPTAATGGVVGSVAAPLFREYLLAFEVTSVLLLAAIVGAVVLGRGRR